MLTLLVQFVLRLSFGLALTMALAPPRLVSSGYYRNHSYVLLGLNVLAATIALTSSGAFPGWSIVTAAVLSYVSSVCWLYESPRAGRGALLAVSAVSLIAAWTAPTIHEAHTSGFSTVEYVLWQADVVSSGLVLGSMMAAMFLGHWFLNTPTMKIDALRRLVLLAGAAIVLRLVLCGVGLALEISNFPLAFDSRAAFIALRWLAGLVAAMIVVVMTWLTLKIPNTQSATGILYVGVIVTFLGELTAQLLSAETQYPV